MSADRLRRTSAQNYIARMGNEHLQPLGGPYFLCPQPGPLVDVGVELEPPPPQLQLADLPHPPPPTILTLACESLRSAAMR